MEVHYITKDNYLEANDALRDILFLYHDAVISYGGFGDSLDTGTFDPFKYIDAAVIEQPGSCLGIELELLHQGSSVALLCGLLDEFACSEKLDTRADQWARKIRIGLSRGMFDHLPIAKNAAQLAFVDEDTFFEALPAVYEAYVRGYYAKMLKEADGGGGQAGVGGTSNSKLSRPARRP